MNIPARNIVFRTNYDLIRTNKFLFSCLLVIIYKIHYVLIAFSLIFTLSHLKTYYGLESGLCLHNHIINESRKQNIIGITMKSVIQVE